MDENQLHYFSNEGMQRNVQHHVKQTTGKSIRKPSSQPYPRPEYHTKSPSNPFIIWFRSERNKIPNCSHEQNKHITSQLEARWKSMNKEEKAPFYYEARKAKRLHKKKFPSYEFQEQKMTRQKVKSIQPTSETVKKPKENKVELKTSNNRKEDVMTRCMAELVKLMNSPPRTQPVHFLGLHYYDEKVHSKMDLIPSPKEDVMSRCMAELEKLMDSASPNGKNYSGHMPTKSSSKIGNNEKKCSKENVMNRCMAELEQLMNKPPHTRNKVCETTQLRKDDILRRVRDELIAKISAEQTPQYPSFMYPGYPSHTPYNSPCFPSPGYSYSSPFYCSSHAATPGYGFFVNQNEQCMHQDYNPSFFQKAPQLEDSQFFNSYYH